ncbi:MAG: DciA family protein [Candidatus Acidiferrales bacterium]
MEKAGDFLGGALRMMRQPEAVLAWLTGAWPSIVGEALAVHTRPVRCQGGVLEIATDGKPWRNQIDGLAREFSARINQSWGHTLVREVKFAAPQPGPQRAHRNEDNAHTPFIRRKKA